MAFVPLDDLTTPLTRQEVEDKIYQVLALIGVTTTTWKTGGVVRTMITAIALIASGFSALQALIARSGFLEYAEGAWLALVAKYVYGVDKRYATFATGSVTLTNSGGGIFAVSADDITFVNTATGATYRNADPFTLGALSTITITVRAVETGSASTAAPGAIDALQNPLARVTCTNATAVIGLDDEEDPSLRVRCYEKLGSLSPMGPWDAYGYAARTTARVDGSSVGVTRVRTNKDGFGNVFLYVATASGAVPGTVGDTSTDLGLVDLAVQKRAAPLAVRGVVAAARTVTINIAADVWIYNTSGLTETQIGAAILARLVAFMPSQPIGGNIIGVDTGKVFVDAIRASISASLPQIFHVNLNTPSIDPVLAIDQVPVLGSVAINITQVAPSEGLL